MPKSTIDSDGVLYKMQQEAIRQAKETASKSTLHSKPHILEEKTDMKPAKQHLETIEKPIEIPQKLPLKPRKSLLGDIFKGDLFSASIFKGDFFNNLKTEDIILIGLILFLFTREDKDIELILALAYIFLA